MGMGHSWIKWVGLLKKSESLFGGKYARKTLVYIGVPFPVHHMSTGFGLFEVLLVRTISQLTSHLVLVFKPFCLILNCSAWFFNGTT